MTSSPSTDRQGMKIKRFYIIPQRYPTHTGERPLSFAIYFGREFLAYSWSLSRAWVALQLIKETYNRGKRILEKGTN